MIDPTKIRTAQAFAWLRGNEIVADTVAFKEEWSEGIARDCYMATDPIAVPVIVISKDDFEEVKGLNRDTALARLEALKLDRDGTDTTDAKNAGVMAAMEALRGME